MSCATRADVRNPRWPSRPPPGSRPSPEACAAPTRRAGGAGTTAEPAESAWRTHKGTHGCLLEGRRRLCQPHREDPEMNTY